MVRIGIAYRDIEAVKFKLLEMVREHFEILLGIPEKPYCQNEDIYVVVWLLSTSLGQFPRSFLQTTGCLQGTRRQE